jgi:hypothetical protein
MKRRTAMKLPLAALATGLMARAGETAAAEESPSPGPPPDATKERHQMALMLLLMNDLARTGPKMDFFKPYNSQTYPNTIFGKNNIDPVVFQAAQSAFTIPTTQHQLTRAIEGLRAHTRLMGIKVQNASNIYDPADPCPYTDAGMASATVKLLTA